MRFWRVRFTIGRLMVLVALLAVASALIRVHLSLAAMDEAQDVAIAHRVRTVHPTPRDPPFARGASASERWRSVNLRLTGAMEHAFECLP